MRVRAAASALLAGAVLSVLAGCGLVTPVATQFDYAPSDGVQGTVGEVRILNALVLSEAGSDDGNLLFVAHNAAEEAVTLNVQYEARSGRVTLNAEIPPNSTRDFGAGDGGQLLLTGIDAEPGDLFEVYFQYGREEGLLLAVPVLDASLPHYEEHLPTPAATPSVGPSSTPGAEGE